MNAASCAVGLCACRVSRLALALAAALALSACIGPDMGEIGDYGASLSPFASTSVAPKPEPVQVFIASTRKGESGAAAREQAPEARSRWPR